jgi:hypothetical protein
MYIPIGNDMAVRDSSIIGIFDMDNCSWSYRTREFLKQAEEKGEIIPATDDLPKTFLVSMEYGMNKVYLIKFNSTVIEHRRVQ